MTKFQKVRLAIVNTVAVVFRVPIRVREHYLMGFGYTDTMPRASSPDQAGAA